MSMKVLALSFALCYAAVSIIFRHMGRRAEKTLVQVKLRLAGRELELTALEDTGNELCDPISGEKVMVIGRQAACELLGMELPGEAGQAVTELGPLGLRPRLLSFSSLGGQGVMLCLRPEMVEISGEKCSRLLGIAPGEICPSGEYRAII